jgi:hypothetical protein
MPNESVREMFLCPVCGYDGLEEAPYDQHGLASFVICPCCGTEFGYTDAVASHAALRRRWIELGMRWSGKIDKAPANWDGLSQLKKAGLSE